MSRWLPSFEINETTSTYFSLGQNLYTPEVITDPNPDPDDRPYAAFLYGSLGFSSVTDNHVDDLELTLGVVGPLALGEETQKTVHDITGGDEPRGWDSQLENEPGVILSWQRYWPEAFASDVGPLFFRVQPHAGASIGNVYTHAMGGLTLQLTPKKHRWQAHPLRVRPAIPGNGFFHVPEDKFAWSVHAGVESRAVGRNIFLDGNTFEDSPSVDKKHFVTDANVGLSTTFGRTQIAYTLNWRSKEFEGQNDPAVFGAVSVGYRF